MHIEGVGSLRAGKIRLRFLLSGKGAIKGRPLPRNGFYPYAAAVPLHDSLADGQADAGAGIFLARVQTLKNIEDAVEVFRGDSQPCIAHGENPLRGLTPRADVNARRIRAAKLDAIPQTVL